MAFPSMQPMQPMTFSGMNFDAFNAQTNSQKQDQKSSQAASTGDASAGSGQIASNQNSNMLTNGRPRFVQPMQPMTFSGMNFDAFNAQTNAQKQDQKSSQAASIGDASAGSGQIASNQNSNMLTNGRPRFVQPMQPMTFSGMNFDAFNAQTNAQKQDQKSSQAASIGDASAGSGQIASNQNSNMLTNGRPRFGTVTGAHNVPAEFLHWQPMTFGIMNFDAFNGQTNAQKQKQKASQAASTGDPSADSGQIASNQNSNMLTNANGPLTNAGSQGGCAGGNCALSGAAQLQAGDQSQGQKQGANQNLLGQKGSNGLQMPNLLNNNMFNNANLNAQKQTQKTSQAASTGDPSADSGQIASNQNSNMLTNANGPLTNAGFPGRLR
ncbi:putative uncharacterized protein DDB_G0286901 isoform X2 [Paramacrobiotus metropolitanus]|nr:putative uncharacterized protein DDB_G0286901 isoform X2 [Paramacrobiotus metropolitanus]XP_055343505.1 putative uncharacterized protein DDB_G0286901 isoform X2 [Paramacrobiotus metropolitanus]XP_055343507.1 putative uncharacterized protein DDB_G0286901 isoform X2 [Paramacrobiotus metropolitanus]